MYAFKTFLWMKKSSVEKISSLKQNKSKKQFTYEAKLAARGNMLCN